MLPDELLFDGHPVAHVSAYYNRLRLNLIKERQRQLLRRR